MLKAISPIDGRYASKTNELQSYFSEFALIKYRVFVEIQYFIALCEIPLPQLKDITKKQISTIQQIFDDFSITDAETIKQIERTTNHDVKAVEYYLKTKFDQLGIDKQKEFIHFALTSQDVNNTATPLLVQSAVKDIYFPLLEEIIENITILSHQWKDVPMLARTHGQPASPTKLGKEMMVFIERLTIQQKHLAAIKLRAKFGGATGNFNAHFVSYPDIDWRKFANDFVKDKLALKRSQFTTQIEHYDELANLFQTMARINTILIDFARDIWTYISMDYFKQKIIQGEVGSSAMPHKVNPIDFENAEGNLGIANALFNHLASKLPISRLQRDLTDSTVLRNIGVPVAHSILAFKALKKGMGKLLLNQSKIDADLENNWMVVAEAIQNILRREGYPKPYEALKALTRNNDKIDKATFHNFIDTLDISTEIKNELKAITPQNYLGIFWPN